MKTLITNPRRSLIWLAMATGAFLSDTAWADIKPQLEKHQVIVVKDGDGKGEGSAGSGTGSRRKIVRIEADDPGREKESTREVAWLGVATEEASEVLASQLGLKSGEGLVVSYVAPDSPAAKAGLQKHDVLVKMGDQLLVLPAQLRKLVQLKKEGDNVELVLHRGGKTEKVSATLSKRTEELGMSFDHPLLDGERHELEFALPGSHLGEQLREEIKTLHGSLARAGIDKKTVNVEVQRNMDEVRKAIQEALRHSDHSKRTFGADATGLEQLARGKMEIEKDASVTLKKDGASVKTVVKSDEAGVYVIVANPKKHLTAHDKDGKLLFDGPIESEEQQKKVPADLWKKVKPTLDEIKPIEEGEPKPQAAAEDQSKI